MQDFFDMGAYSSFIWAAYITTAVVMVGLFVASWQRLRAREAALADLLETFDVSTPVGPVDVSNNHSCNDFDNLDSPTS